MHKFRTIFFAGAARHCRSVSARGCALLLAALALGAGDCGAVNIMEFGLIVPQTSPERIVVGPDGNYWWVGSNISVIGKFTPEGLRYQWSIPTANSRPFGITVGADGNLWFTESFSGDVYNPGGNRICRAIITTNAPIMKEFAIHPEGGNPGPSGITSGPDGNLWVLESQTGKIAVMSTNGTLVKEFVAPFPATSYLWNIITGPDGNLWFNDSNNGLISAMTTNGAVAGFFLGTNSEPADIVVGPDNALWFTEYNTNKIGRLATTVFSAASFSTVSPTSTTYFNPNVDPTALTEFPLPNNIYTNVYPLGITAGIDGDIYFTEWFDAKVGRFTPVITSSGVTMTNFVEYTCPTTNSNPRFIAAGPDGKVWFAEYTGNIIGQLTTTLPTINIQPLNSKQVVLNWDTNRGFALQYENLGSGSNGWITSQSVPIITNGLYSLTVANPTNRLFRLHGVY